MTLTLPWPPSINRYWRSVRQPRGCVLVSEEGRRYQRLVKQHVLVAGLRAFGDLDRLSVSVIAYPPDRRARDLDNLLKALSHALVDAGVLADDCDAEEIHLCWRGEGRPCEVTLAKDQLCQGVASSHLSPVTAPMESGLGQLCDIKAQAQAGVIALSGLERAALQHLPVLLPAQGWPGPRPGWQPSW